MNARRSRLLLVWGFIVLGSQLGSGAPVQWEQNGHSYEVVVYPEGEGRSWNDAQADAEAKGGYLATITSAQENDFVYGLTVSTPGAWGFSAEWAIGPWLGGYQDRSAPDYSEPSGGWRWVTGEPWEYTNWLQDPYDPQPDDWLGKEDYLIYWGLRDIMPTWNDGIGETIIRSYVIEYDSQLHISSIEPSSGAPGIRVTILGENFLAPCLQEWVNFGPSEIWGTGIPSKDISWTDTEIVVEVPKPALPNPSGERVVELTVQKRFPTQASNSVSFTYKMPHIDSITPSSATPRTEVVIRGQNFGVPNKLLPEGYGIKFGKSNAYYWKSWTDNEIVIKAPKDYGTGETEQQILKWIEIFLKLGITEDMDDFIIDVIEELLSGLEARPGEGEIQVNVIVATPVGESNAEPFTFIVK